MSTDPDRSGQPTTSGEDPGRQLRHELRTPLNQIIGYTELLEEEAESAGRLAEVGDLRRILVAARRLVGLTDLIPGMESAQPVSPLAGPAEPHDEPRSPATDWQRESAAVLVVDDSAANRDMLARRLEARGYRVEAAHDGYQALARLAAGPFDLVLLDLMMPGMSGLDVLRKIRETWVVTELPVIMATASNDSDNLVSALQLGANDYVTKPLDFPVVMARMKTQLALRRAHLEIRRLADELERRNRFIRAAFGRYVSDEVVDRILESPEGLALGGTLRRVTVLMADVRGFTALSESLAAGDVVTLLNNHLGVMADLVHRYGGIVDNFIGDEVLAVFGALVTRPDDAERALACAVAMQLAMPEVNRFNTAHGLPTIAMGVAVHSGDVVAGNIGSQRRSHYSVIGRTVNETARVEGFTLGGEILTTDATLASCTQALSLGAARQMSAKGLGREMTIYPLRGIGGVHNLLLPDEVLDEVSLLRPVPVTFFRVDQKRIGGWALPGELLAVSHKGARIRSSAPVTPMENLKLILLTANPPATCEAYIKVTDVHASAQSFSVRFTSLQPEAESVIDHLILSSTPDPSP